MLHTIWCYTVITAVTLVKLDFVANHHHIISHLPLTVELVNPMVCAVQERVELLQVKRGEHYIIYSRGF